MRALQRGDKGVALLITLMILVLIVTMVWEVFRLGARAAQTGAYSRDSIRAAIVAEGGINATRIALREDADDNQYDTLDEIWSRPVPPIDLGEGTIGIVVEDEERKININRLVLPNGNAADDQKLAVFRRLLEILEIDPLLADAVVDWIDNDDTPRVGSAESAFYLSRPFPYQAKNDFLDTVDELRLIRGVTPEVFEKLRPFVTVYSSGKVNLNTAPKQVIMALSAGRDAADAGEITEAGADEIIEYRKEKPFQKIEEIRNVSPFLSDLYQKTRFRDLLEVRGTAFHVRSAGEVAGTVRTIDAVGIRTGKTIHWRYWRVE
ncbi:MAG TPA: type II secretion system minor pseudopilin GspK [Candidatus Limnocylindria bacterium]|nr:type II secretion system minor pseudopilin GspK [Candidatus Limnocylindria bacterium]